VKEATGEIDVTVAIPPTSVALTPPGDTLALDVGGQTESSRRVTCEAKAARPAPVFKWFIGETEITGDVVNDEKDIGGDKADYTSVLTYHAATKHNGQELRCQVEHEGYTQAQLAEGANRASLKLALAYKPVPQKTELKFFNLKLGAPYKVKVKFDASPRPEEARWSVYGIKGEIAAGASSLDQNAVASAIGDGDYPGQYVLSLSIKRVTEEMTGKFNRLVVKNEKGSTEYKFMLELGQKPKDGMREKQP